MSPPLDRCYGCDTPYRLQAAFCAKCGAQRDPLRAVSTFSLRASLVLYCSLLAICIAVRTYAQVTEQEFGPVVVGSAAILGVSLLVSLGARSLVGPALTRFGFGRRGLALILAIAPLGVAAIALYVRLLDRGFHLHLESDLSFLEGHSILWAVLVLVVLAPLGEELAFRGLVFPGLARSIGRTEAFAITAFAFGILHLSIPGLVTHVPLGLYLCWLRDRSASVWPPILAHALHNLGALLLSA